MTDAPVELAWLDADRFRVGTTEFVYSYQPGSTAESFHIIKKRELVEAYVDVLRPLRGSNVVELGIAQGGSVALMELVAAPHVLVALDLNAAPVTGLTDFIERRGIGDRIHAHWGVDQGDRARVLGIVTDALAGEPLDLVIDDASHLLEPTLASFETLFPLLRPGGRYLIEDWSWQYQMVVNMRSGLDQPESEMRDRFSEALAARLADPDPDVRARQQAELAHYLPDPESRRLLVEHVTGTSAGTSTGSHASVVALPADSPLESGTLSPLPALAIDLMLARATSGDVVADVHIDEFWISVTRGPARLDPGTFRLADTFEDHLGVRFH